MKIKPILLLLIVVSFMITVSESLFSQEANVNTSTRDLSEYLTDALNRFDTPAIAASVVSTKKVIASGAIGKRRMDKADKVTILDKFHIGSCTKSITALLAGILVEKGILDWNSKLTDFFSDEISIHSGYNNVTFLDILQHRSGMPSYNTSATKIPEFSGTLTEQRLKFASFMLEQEPESTPGQFKYSNAGYAVVGKVLEKISGRSWEELTKEHVFDPLNLTSADFGNPASIDPEQPWGHWQRWKNQTPTEPVSPEISLIDPIEAASGDIHMSITDISKYIQAHLKGLHNKEEVFKPELIQELHQPNGEYALGWYIRNIAGEKVSWHAGSNTSFVAVMAICHDIDLAVAVVVNSSIDSANRGCGVIMEELIRQYK